MARVKFSTPRDRSSNNLCSWSIYEKTVLSAELIVKISLLIGVEYLVTLCVTFFIVGMSTHRYFATKTINAKINVCLLLFGPSLLKFGGTIVRTPL